MRCRFLAVLLFAAALGGASMGVHARLSTESISASRLPPEARQLLSSIKAGGPFRYERDGIVFANREHQLPSRPRGYYHEYTVPTPSARDRGARRIVCGGPRFAPDACYYTSDHYQTFRRIVE